MRAMKILAGVAAIAGVTLFAPTAKADTTFNLDYTFSGTAPATVDDPWIVVNVVDGITNASGTGIAGVRVDVTNNLSLTSTEFLSRLYLNMAAPISNLAFRDDTGQNGVIEKGSAAFGADGDGLYDIRISFPTSGSEVGTTADTNRFGGGETASFYFWLTSGTLHDVDFNLLSTPRGGNGTYFAAAHIQSIDEYGNPTGDGQLSGWIGAPDSDNDTTPPDNNPVPEPATLAMLGLGVLTLSRGKRKTRR